MAATNQAPLTFRSVGEVDPLLAALIGKLPPGNASWPHAKRIAWLELMFKAFDVVYENDGAVIEMPKFLPGAGAMADATMATTIMKAAPAATPAAEPPFRQMGGHAFYIDKKGRACRAGGGQIMPAEIPAGEIVYDLRGEAGDLGAIEWQDGSTGVRGLQVSISAA